MANEGNMFLGIVVGAVLAVVIGWLPLYTGIAIAGIAAGWLTRDAAKGAAAGFIGGFIGSFILGAILYTILASAISSIDIFNTSSSGSYGGSAAFTGAGISALIAFAMVYGIVAGIGGAIGGYAHRGGTGKEEQKGEKEEEVPNFKALKARYLKGDISKKQYEQMKKVLEED